MIAPDCTATDFTFKYKLEANKDRYNPRVIAVIFTNVGVNFSVDLGSIWGAVEVRSYCCGAEYGWPSDGYLFCNACGDSTTHFPERPDSISDVFADGNNVVYERWFNYAGLLASPLLADQLGELVREFYRIYENVDESRRTCSTEEELQAYALEQLGGSPVFPALMPSDPRLLSCDFSSHNSLIMLWSCYAFELRSEPSLHLAPLSYCCTTDLEPQSLTHSRCSHCSALLPVPAAHVQSFPPTAAHILPYSVFDSVMAEEEADHIVKLVTALVPLLPQDDWNRDEQLHRELKRLTDPLGSPL